jgi:hypothetical protein
MIARIKKTAKWLLAIKISLIGALVLLSAYTSVSTRVTADDIRTFHDLGLRKNNNRLSFEEEIRLIRQVQHEVFKRSPYLGVGIPSGEAREPADLMRFGQGLCYDRSRTFDKAFSYLGMKSRHVYLLYKENMSFLDALFHRGQSSHAVTEVKTSKGWMLVDSNTAWIAITRDGEPVNADDVWRRFGEFHNAPSYLAFPWWAIRGLYSRKGKFYGSGIAFPELNWSDFLIWTVSLQ